MEQFTWEFLGTFAGCVVATATIVQLLKGFKPFSLISTQIFSYFVAVLIFNAAALVLGSWSWSEFGLAWLNAAIVALTSNGAYAAAKKIMTSLKGSQTEENE